MKYVTQKAELDAWKFTAILHVMHSCFPRALHKSPLFPPFLQGCLQDQFRPGPKKLAHRIVVKLGLGPFCRLIPTVMARTSVHVHFPENREMTATPFREPSDTSCSSCGSTLYKIELEKGLPALPGTDHGLSPKAPINMTEEHPKGLRLAFIIVALVMAMFLVALDMTIVATAIPRITDDFHSLDQVGWYGAGFFLTVAAFQSAWGKAYKFFPLKMAFIISFAIFELGSLLCGVARNSAMLIVGRAIAGMVLRV